jgi:hypothetical protein
VDVSLVVEQSLPEPGEPLAWRATDEDVHRLVRAEPRSLSNLSARQLVHVLDEVGHVREIAHDHFASLGIRVDEKARDELAAGLGGVVQEAERQATDPREEID